MREAIGLDQVNRTLLDIENRVSALTDRLAAYYEGAQPTRDSLSSDLDMARSVTCQLSLLRVALMSLKPKRG